MLMNLPNAIKLLINRGVYSLYSLPRMSGNASYLLVTDERETFFVDSEGKLLDQGGPLESIVVSKPILFPDLQDDDLIKVNVG